MKWVLHCRPVTVHQIHFEARLAFEVSLDILALSSSPLHFLPRCDLSLSLHNLWFAIKAGLYRLLHHVWLCSVFAEIETAQVLVFCLRPLLVHDKF